MRASRPAKDPADFLVSFSRRAASHVRCGCRRCRSDSARNALSPIAQSRHGFVCQTLPEVESGMEGNEAIDALAGPDTPPRAEFRIDYTAWLSRLPARDRGIAQDMASGKGTEDLAQKHRLSQARISQLRRECTSTGASSTASRWLDAAPARPPRTRPEHSVARRRQHHQRTP